MNKTICTAPLSHLHIDKNGEVVPCCGATNRENINFGNVNDTPITEIFNSQKIKDFRNDIINGIESTACKNCYEVEKNGGNSYREWFNKTYPIEKYKKYLNDDYSLSEIKIEYVDVRFSNVCNFKCRSCDSQSSSSIAAEEIKFDLPNKLDKSILQLNNSNVIEFLNGHYNNIKKFYFAGGEPLIMEEHYTILEDLITIKKFDTELSYNTNLSTLTYKNYNICDKWKEFYDVTIFASIDGIGEIGEYIRHGFNYDEFVNNFKTIKETCPRVKFTINVCVSIFNVFHLLEMIPTLIDIGILNPNQFTFNILNQPQHQSITVLPAKYKDLWVEKMEEFKVNSKYPKINNELDTVKNFMLSNDDSHLIDTFYNVVKFQDNLRNEDYFKILPNFRD